MKYNKEFSVIVPTWRDAIKYLPKLFESIPQKEGIEIIVVDNSKETVSREEIESTRDIVFLHSAPERHAGGSRNDGMAVAKGKWLLFADADDYYTPDAFDVYYSMFDSDAEIVYTGMGGVYADTGEPSGRGKPYAELVHRYCNGECDDVTLRVEFSSPCCKMVSHELVDRYNIIYDEIRAGNDNYFSIASGLKAKKIDAVDKVTYIASINRGSLTKRRDYEVIKARLYSKLHCNQLLREYQLYKYQQSVMFAIAESRHYGINKTLEFIKMIISFHQNPFVGWRNWLSTIKSRIIGDKKEKGYIVR